MKNVLLNFADNLLSKNEMKSLRGGKMLSCGASACLGTNADCTPAGCTTCSTSDKKTPGSCS